MQGEEVTRRHCGKIGHEEQIPMIEYPPRWNHLGEQTARGRGWGACKGGRFNLGCGPGCKAAHAVQAGEEWVKSPSLLQQQLALHPSR